MLSRPARWRFAFLALLATMLLVLMPTLAQLRASASAHGEARAHVMHHATAGMAGHDAAPARGDGHDGHDGTCPYCPLLAGLLHWNVTPALVPHAGPAGFVSGIHERPPFARTRQGTLGSRGPPASRAA